MAQRITKRAIDALRPVEGKPAVIWDGEIKGFGCRANLDGSKTYILQYRAGSGRSAPERKLTIGRHGSPYTVETARDVALRLLGKVKDGADPASDKSARRAAPNVGELCERFLSEHVETKRKGSTAAEYRRLLAKHVIGTSIAGTKVQDVSAKDMERLHHARRDSPYDGNRLLAVLSAMFNLAERWNLRPANSNPCRQVEKFPERKRERMLSADELAALGEALTGYEPTHAYAVAALRLLVFTGARRGEILGLQWEWIDQERGEARLPDSKTGAKTLHLPPPALAVLTTVKRIEGNPHVIVGGVEGAALVNLKDPWREIRDRATVLLWGRGEGSAAGLVETLRRDLEREPAADEVEAAATAKKISLPTGLRDLRVHDLRHGFASIAASSGMGLPIIGKILGHTQAATTNRYAHLASDPVKAAAATVAGRIADAMAPRPSTENVVTFGPKTRS